MATTQNCYTEEQDAVYENAVFCTLLARMPEDTQAEGLGFISSKLSSEELTLL